LTALVATSTEGFTGSYNASNLLYSYLVKLCGRWLVERALNCVVELTIRCFVLVSISF